LGLFDISITKKKNHLNLAYLYLIEAKQTFFDATEVNNIKTLEPYRKIWKDPLITAGGFSTLRFAEKISKKTDNLISYGHAFVAKHDFPKLLRNEWPLYNIIEIVFILMFLQTTISILSIIRKNKRSNNYKLFNFTSMNIISTYIFDF
jgi:hypothetical protein